MIPRHIVRADITVNVQLGKFEEIEEVDKDQEQAIRRFLGQPNETALH
jgi:hypothetical protein